MLAFLPTLFVSKVDLNSTTTRINNCTHKNDLSGKMEGSRTQITVYLRLYAHL